MNFKRGKPGATARLRTVSYDCPFNTIFRTAPHRDSRAMTVDSDLAAIGHLHWTVAQDIAMDPAEWDCECESCEHVAEVHSRYYRITASRICPRGPLRATLAEIARAA